MINRKWKIKKSFYFLLVVVVMMAFIAFVEKKDMERPYRSLEVYVQGISEVYFVEESEIIKLLQNEFPSLKPGISLGEISLGKIEKKVESHPFVKNAEVFKDLKGHVVVKIEQHRPVARIIRPSAAHGYISAEGEILPTSTHYTSRVMTVEGPMAEDLLQLGRLSGENKKILELIHFIEKDDFWKAQIAGFEIDNKMNVNLYPQVGQEKIEFGRPVDIAEKFEKINLYYKEIRPVKGWKSYKRVNVKYKDQIICE